MKTKFKDRYSLSPEERMGRITDILADAVVKHLISQQEAKDESVVPSSKPPSSVDK